MYDPKFINENNLLKLSSSLVQMGLLGKQVRLLLQIFRHQICLIIIY
jgi:hypothetical protein